MYILIKFDIEERSKISLELFTEWHPALKFTCEKEGN